MAYLAHHNSEGRGCELSLLLKIAEDWVCSYIPAVGRFLIVCTFIEDAIRIMTQWSDQLLYLHDYRHSTIPPSFPSLQIPSPAILTYPSTMGPNPPLPPRQCHRHVHLLHPSHHPQIPRIRRLRPNRRCRNASPRLWPYLRP